jgi:16S rRNA processing protein RimM
MALRKRVDDMPAREKKRVLLGAFAGAHGVKGDAKIKCFTEKPEDIVRYGALETEDGARFFTLRVVRKLKGGFIAAAAPEIESRGDAEGLKGMRLYVARSALPEVQADEFYIDDLVGLAAFDEAGAPLGRVLAVHNFGAGDILELADIPGVEGGRLIVFTKENAPAVDMGKGVITLRRDAIEDAADAEDA